MIKSLPKKFEMKYRSLPYFYDDDYITNGHWILLKNKLKESNKYCVITNEIQPDLKRIIKTNSDLQKKFVITKNLLDEGNMYARIFECKESGEKAFFNEEYVKHFNVKELYSNDLFGVFFTKELDFGLMQMNVKE